MHTHVHSHLGHFRLAWFWEVEGKQKIWRQPTQTKGEHVKLIRWQSQSPHWKRTPNHAALRFSAEALRFLTRNFTVIVTFMWSLGKLRGIYSYYNANYRRVTGKGKINIKFICKLFSAHCYYTFHCTLAPILQANPIGASKMPPTALKKRDTGTPQCRGLVEDMVKYDSSVGFAAPNSQMCKCVLHCNPTIISLSK